MFSREKLNKTILALHTRRAKTQSKGGINNDYDIKHAGEIRDGTTGNFTVLKQRIKDEHTKYLKDNATRRIKLGKRL